VGFLLCGLGAVGLGGLAYCLPFTCVVIIALSLSWVGRRRLPAGVAATGRLSVNPDGQWELASARSACVRGLRPARAWLAPAWVTIRFCGAGADSKDTMQQVTIWKSSVSPEAWRQLRVRLAGLGARPAFVAARAG